MRSASVHDYKNKMSLDSVSVLKTVRQADRHKPRSLLGVHPPACPVQGQVTIPGERPAADHPAAGGALPTARASSGTAPTSLRVAPGCSEPARGCGSISRGLFGGRTWAERGGSGRRGTESSRFEGASWQNWRPRGSGPRAVPEARGRGLRGRLRRLRRLRGSAAEMGSPAGRRQGPRPCSRGCRTWAWPTART